MAARLSGRPTPGPNTNEENSPSTSRPGASTPKWLLAVVAVLSVFSISAILAGAYFFTLGPGAVLLGGAQTHEQAKFEPGPMTDLGPFTVNLSPLDEKRYLRTSFTFAFATNDKAYTEGSQSKKEAWLEAFKEEIKEKQPIFKDVVVTSLSKKSAEQLSTPEGKESLKAELMTQMNDFLKKEELHIKDVYFTDFIIQ